MTLLQACRDESCAGSDLQLFKLGFLPCLNDSVISIFMVIVIVIVIV